jgi:two-component system, OmpR family, response regulator
MSENSPEPDTPDPPRRIMVVDDEPSLSRLTRINLENAGGYVVCEVNRPLNAINAAREFKPELILMDVVMPMLDGGELAEKFRAHPEFAQVPIVFLTSTIASSETGGLGFVSHNERYLSKPIFLPTLLRTLAAVLDGTVGDPKK